MKRPKDRQRVSSRKSGQARGTKVTPATGAGADAEIRFRTLFDSLDAAVLLMHGPVCVECNPATLRIFGLASKDEIIGKTPLDFAPPCQPDGRDSSTAIQENIERTLRTGLHVFEWLTTRKDGTPIFLEVRITPYRIGNEQYFQCIAIDITGRKKAAEEIAERNAMLQQIMDTASVAIFLVDKAGRITHANKRMAEIFGCPLNELIGSEYVAHVHPAEREMGRQRMLALLASEIQSVDLERRYWRQNGSEFWGHLAGRRFRNTRGADIGLIGVIIDITERKRAEESLRKSEFRTRSIIESIPMGMHLYRLEPGGRLVFAGANPAADRILGVDNSIFIGKTIEEAFPPLARTEVPRRYREVAETGNVWHTETIDYDSGGIKGAFEVHAFRTGPDTMVAAFENITERKRAELALKESESRFRALFENVNVVALVMDPSTGRILDANTAAAAYYGWTREQLRSMHIWEINTLPRDEIFRRMELVRNREKSSFLLQHRRADGSVRDVEVHSGPIPFQGTTVLYSVIHDITERRLLEEERLKTQKLESIGTLAGGIAHDFNNLLQGIFGYISMAKITHDERERSLDMLDRAEKALHRSVNLTNQLLTFSKGGKPLKTVLALRGVIDDAVKLALSGSPNTAVLDLPRDLLPVEADEGQLGQVLQNMVLNADQAMPLGGSITIRGRNVPAEAGGAGASVEITITDQGTGIPPEHLPRIFDPYFTTKEKGSGLGLATSYSIIRNHGGDIRVASDLGKGSAFTIRLPAAAGAVPPKPEPAPPAAARSGRILVMDDEEIVRAVTGELLKTLGHTAEFTADGAAAIARYRDAREAGRPFDVIILDLTVRGGMGGVEALRRLREHDPTVKAVMSSGYSDDSSVSRYREEGFAAFLKKPYDVNELRRVLTALLQ